jgi:prepilin-type N-terminal cleavage/methylation domain-containing protein
LVYIFKPKFKGSLNLTEYKNLKAFSLIEISIVVLIIGVIVTGIVQSSGLIRKYRINNARSLTQSSIVSSTDNLVLWLETTSADSFQSAGYSDSNPLAASSGSVAWYDLNKKNNALSTSNSPYASNPTYTLNAINGLPALSFNGSSQYLALTDSTILAATSYTVFVVEQPAKISGTYNYFIAASGSCSVSTCFAMGHGNISSGTYTIYMSHYSNDIATTASNITGLGYQTYKPILHSGFFTIGGSRKYFYNGTAGNSDSNAAAISSNSSMTIGNAAGLAAGFYQGMIGEIIIFNRNLSTQERWAIETYLGQKWGITTNQQS